jgi:hypothetical protein
LKDREIGDICDCVRIYLAGVMQFDDEMKHNMKNKLQDQDLRRDMDEIIKEKYQIEEKREFLLNSSGGVNVVCFAGDYLLRNMIDYCNLKCQEKRRCSKQLKKKIKKIKGKDDESEGSDKSDSDAKEEESEISESEDRESGEESEEEESEGSDKSDEESGEEGDGDEMTDSVKQKSENDGKRKRKKERLVLDCGRDRPLIWE